MSQKSKKKGGKAQAPVKETRIVSAVPVSGGAPAVAVTEDIEPQATEAAVPVWLAVIMIILAYWAMLHLDRYAGGFSEFVYGPYTSYKELDNLQPKSGSEMLIAKGQFVYTQVCMPCHQATGMGAPGQAPPLVGSEWVLGSTNRLARIPLNGLIGTITVKGTAWQNVNMPPFRTGPYLDDDENVAAVLTYIRNAWGNSASPISPAQVKAVRAETEGRNRQWTPEELLKLE